VSRRAFLLPLVVCLGLALPGCGATPSDPISRLIARLESRPLAQRQSAVDSLFAGLPGGTTPVVGDSLAHFLFRGAGNTLALAGDMTGWEPSLPLAHLPGTDLWHLTLPFPPDARLDYKFVRDRTEWLLDPTNPRQVLGGYGPNSELVMPTYVPSEEIQEHGYPAPEVFTHHEVYSPQLDNHRTIQVIMPPGGDPGRRHPVLLVHDGPEYLSLGSLDRVLAWLAVHRPDLPLPICVCVPPADRTAEYMGDSLEPFGRFITETVMTFVPENHPAAAGSRRWGSLGASAGGNVTLYLAGAYPDRFDRLLVMSPLVAPPQRALIAARPADAYRIYLNWGRYDLPALLQPIREFADLLQLRGTPHQARRYNEGHSWGLWRATLAEGLEFLYGPAGS